MASERRLRVFFDSSALIAGIASPGGAAGLLLLSAESGVIETVISRQVLVECDRNISAKLPSCLGRFREFIKALNPILEPDPEADAISHWLDVLPAKDTPIAAAAESSVADILVTNDARHFATDAFMGKTQFKVLSPGDALDHLRQWISG